MTTKTLTFENLTSELNGIVNLKIKYLNKLEKDGIITEKEKQYMYLTFLQKTLEKTEVFNVYVNTNF